MALSGEQIERYSRQILVPEIGGRGQERLLGSTVVRCGASSGIGVAADYLSAAGVAVVDATDRDQQDGTADFVLADTTVSRPREATSEARRLALFEESADGAWYSRNTTTADCEHCIAGSGRAALGQSRTAASSGANVAGAAVALDIMTELLELAPSDRPSVVAVSEAGTVRTIVDLNFETCSHRSREGE